MRNLDSVLNSRDITLATKVHVVKAMVFPVVTYSCESWTTKEADCQRIDAFVFFFFFFFLCLKLLFVFQSPVSSRPVLCSHRAPMDT